MALAHAPGRQAAVFLDKDGTLVRDVPFNDDPERVELMPGVAEGLRELASAGFRLFVVTNQSGLARGLMSAERFAATTARLEALLADEGAHLDGTYVCPHYPEGVVEALTLRCNCRKPRPGLLLQAAAEHRIDLTRSWLIGDILHDVEAGNRAGCRTVLLTGGETEWLPGPYRTPDVTVTGFANAVRAIALAGETVPRRRAL